MLLSKRTHGKKETDHGRLTRYKKIYQNKKILQKIYLDWYQKIIKDLKSGKTLELGSGIGSFKQFKPSIISSDIVNCDWLDMSFDAHKIPFKKNSLSNIVMIDVFHHLSNPIQFLNKTHRVLKKNGRLIMIEPFPSPFSLLIYKLFHSEPFIFNLDYFSKKHSFDDKKTPWASNQAIPYLLLFKQLDKFNHLFKKKFNLVKKEKFSFLLYPLSGGFENKQLYPDFLFPIIKIIEKLLYPFKDLLAFRCYIVLEKK
ncbi:class I SAM-dependent methyltransferase [Patescibacteria group bacterium]